MKRFLAATMAIGLGSTVIAQQVQIQIAQPAIDVAYPNTPGTQGKDVTKSDFKPIDGSSADPKSLDVPENVLLRCRELVKQLGSPSFREREIASRELTKLGRQAVPALKDSQKAESNPEIILRVDNILPQAEALDMAARVSCFLMDLDGKYEHKLPGWTKFRDMVGDDRSSRELFTEVLKNKSYHNLMLAADTPANELGTLLNNHYQNLQYSINNGFRRTNGNQLATPEIAVLIFLESIYPDKELNLNYNYGYSVTSYMYGGDIQNAMTNRNTGKYSALLRKLVIRWMDTRDSGMGAQMAFNFAQQWNVGDIGKYAGRILEADTVQGNWYVKTNALAVIGQKDMKKCIPQITKVFEDSTIIQQKQPGSTIHTIHLQDFALGVALKLTGQNVKDYGLNEQNAAVNWKWQQTNYYFLDDKDNKADDKRKAAFKKWNEWYAKQPKEGEPKKDDVKKDDVKKDEPKKEELKKEEFKVIPQVLPATPVPLPKK